MVIERRRTHRVEEPGGGLVACDLGVGRRAQVAAHLVSGGPMLRGVSAPKVVGRPSGESHPQASCGRAEVGGRDRCHDLTPPTVVGLGDHAVTCSVAGSGSIDQVRERAIAMTSAGAK